MTVPSIVTRNTIDVAAPVDVLWDLAADVERWPALLPHYRYVERLDAGGPEATTRTVSMGARRTGFPVSWKAQQMVDRTACEVRYRHTGGVTRGMDVVWRFEPNGSTTKVTIDHRLQPTRWWLRNPLAAYVVGHLFVEHIADRTLRGIRRHAERMAQRQGPA